LVDFIDIFILKTSPAPGADGGREKERKREKRIINRDGQDLQVVSIFIPSTRPVPVNLKLTAPPPGGGR
jgi:hypothetical protein